MEFSQQYHKREAFMAALTVPRISAVTSQLGEDLGTVFFQSCPESLKDEMNISSVLEGPGPNLWVSPSDLLIGKVVLKPPLTAKHMKALTHRGILSMGEELEEEWLAQLEKEKERALAYQEELLMLMSRRNKEMAVAEALRLQEEEYQYKVAMFNEEFEQLLQQELERLEDSLRETYEQLLDEKTQELLTFQGELTQDRIDTAVEDTVKELSAKFLKDLEEQEIEISTMFNEKLHEQEEKYQDMMLLQEEACTKILHQIKHTLQCNNIACLMYTLCLERRKCLHEQQMLVNCYLEQIESLSKSVEQKEEQIIKLTKECNQKQHQLEVREECLMGVMQQFQKFINFALKATPTQAEFLLSVEKMMTFELTQALVRTQEGRNKRLARKLMPWRPVSRIDLPTDLDMQPKDFHSCLNELNIPLCKHDPEEQAEELFSVTYKDRLYVREDFRNKVSQGLLKPTQSTIWSQDVEHLINLLGAASKSDVIEDDGESASSVNGSYRSSVHFRGASTDGDNVGILATQDSLILQKSTRSSYADPLMLSEMKVSSLTAGPVALLAAADSVTLLKEKQQSVQHLKPEIVAEEVVHEHEEEAGDESSEREVIQAPSTDTIKLSSPRRASVAKGSIKTLSLETIQLTKSKHDYRTKSTNVSLTSVGVKKPSSKLITKVDLDTTVSALKKKSSTKRRSVSSASRLTQHRDSVELLKQKSKQSEEINRLKDLIVPDVLVDHRYPTQQYVINFPSETKTLPKVNFSKIKQVFKEISQPDEPWTIYQRKSLKPSVLVTPCPSRDDFLRKSNVAHVSGCPLEEKIAQNKDFTIHRMHSLIDVLKKDPSLIRMFTGCGQ